MNLGLIMLDFLEVVLLASYIQDWHQTLWEIYLFFKLNQGTKCIEENFNNNR
jgi:hypothetical protein